MVQLLQLYQLQSLDSEIDQISHQLATIAAQLGESDALKQARAGAEAAQVQLRKLQAKMQDLDLELKSLTAKITNQEKLLYSGRALSAKEAANLQDEVASLKRWQSDREEKLLEAMVEVEDADAALAAARTGRESTEADWLAQQSGLQQTQGELQDRLSALKERRPNAAEKIDAETLRIYENLRKKKAGRAVVAVKNGVCQGCGMTASANKVRQARSGTELMYCGACGRILYVP